MSAKESVAFERQSPSTPANEWADKTKSALHLDANDIAQSNAIGIPLSTASTPGPQLPGAFTRTPASDTAYGISGLDTSIMPAVEDAVLSASEAMKQYLPTHVAAYLPEKSKSDKPSEAAAVPDAIETGSDQPSLLNENASGPSPNSQKFDTSVLTPKTSTLAAQDAVSVSELSTVAQAGSESSKSSLIEPPAVSTPYDSQLPSYLGPLITERETDRPAIEGFTSVDTLHPTPANGSLHPPPIGDNVSTLSTASQETTKPSAPEVPAKEVVHSPDAAVVPSFSSPKTDTIPEERNTPIRTPTLPNKEHQTLFDPTEVNVPASIAPGFDTGPAHASHESSANDRAPQDLKSDAASNQSNMKESEAVGDRGQDAEHHEDDEGRNRSLTAGPTSTSRDELPDGANPNATKELEEPHVNSTPRDHPLGGDGAHLQGLRLDKRGQTDVERKYDEADKTERPPVPPKDNKIDGRPSTTDPSSASPIHPLASPDVHIETPSDSNSNSTGGSRLSGKVSLFSKIKGEAKVISGKLSHNEGKIEEGRRLMGKAPSEVPST